jgi:hypothetical protein
LKWHIRIPGNPEIGFRRDAELKSALSLGEVLLVDRAGHRVLRVHDVGDLDHSALTQELVGVHLVVSVVVGYESGANKEQTFPSRSLWPET